MYVRFRWKVWDCSPARVCVQFAYLMLDLHRHYLFFLLRARVALLTLNGVEGLAWKASRVGERLSPYVAAACLIMAGHALFFDV